MQWYYAANGKQAGPINESELQLLVSKGTILPDTLVWNKTMKDWTPYKTVELSSAVDDSSANNIPDVKQIPCSECKQSFSQTDMIQYRNSWVCAACKPVFLQKLKEGLNVSGAFNYAGFWIRFGAYFIDGLILMVVQLVLFTPVFYLFFTRFNKIASNNSAPDMSDMGLILGLYGLVVFLAFVIKVAYETWFVGKYAATPGKMVCRLTVITADGSTVSYLRACGRYFGKMLSSMTLCIGFIIAAFDDEKRGLHDHICETRVIQN